MRRGTHNRLTTVLRHICTMVDYGLNLEFNKCQRTSCPQHRAVPAERKVIIAAPKELIITTRRIELQHVTTPIVLQADIEDRPERMLEGIAADLFALSQPQPVPASRAE